MSKILDRISKVLNQAENASTPEEAAAFMEAAQKMASLHAIDLAIARQHTAKKEQREMPMQKRISLGKERQRSLKDYVSLFCSIANANDLKINIANNSTYVTLFGMPSDIEVAEALFNSLVVQMVASAENYLASGEYKKEVVSMQKPVYVTELDYFDRPRRYLNGYETVQKAIDGRVARRNFYEGFIASIAQRLHAAKKAALKEHEEAAAKIGSQDTSTALVLASKTEEVGQYYKEHSNARGSYRGRSGGASSHSSRSAGKTAGNNARLSSTGTLAGARSAIGA